MSMFTSYLKFQEILKHKIKGKVYVNQDDSVSDSQHTNWESMSSVFSSRIIDFFFKLLNGQCLSCIGEHTEQNNKREKKARMKKKKTNKYKKLQIQPLKGYEE